MKPNRSTIFIFISTIALIVVLVIQLTWLIQTAQYKEKFFNEKADIVRSRSTETISTDTILCYQIKTHISQKEINTVDSIIRSNMKFYGFNEKYEFEILTQVPSNPFAINYGKIDLSNQQACHSILLDSLNNENGWELRLRFPDKQQFILSEMGLPFLSSLGLIVVVLLFFWRTVYLLTKEKKIANHSTEFLNNMTHELKTPLTNISLAGKMIMKDLNPEKIKHYSGIILEENEKLRLQVEQVLSMTALERGEIPIQKTELDFHQLIKDALKSMSLQLEQVNGKVTLDLQARQFVVMGDKTHLTNALCNLIDNAIKYSKESPEISIHTKNIVEDLILEFRDQGIGIENEYQKKVFEKFFRVPKGNLHDVKGFGLGLAYVKKIIELHGGKIELISEKGKGTTFIISLPHD